MTKKLILTLCAGVAILLAAGSLFGQKVIRTIDRNAYEHAIALVFPMSLEGVPHDHGYVIRVKPSFNAEFMIRVWVSGGDVTMTHSESANGNLYYFFSDIVERTDIEDPTILAQKVKVKRETKVFPRGRFLPLERQLAASLASTVINDTRKNPHGGKIIKDRGSAVVILDGTVYELQIVSAQDEIISFRTYDYPLEAKAFDSPIVSWIKSVKELFEAKANL